MPANDRETWLKLLYWDHGHTQSERLAADILDIEGFHSIDPSHPLGGPDGLKDIVLKRDGLRWIAAAYFPHGEKGFSEVYKKFVADFAGVPANDAQGFAFVTNQPLSITDKAKLVDSGGSILCEIFHLERLRLILDGLRGVPVRQRYLGIPVSGEDLVAAVGQLEQFSKLIAATSPTAMVEQTRRSPLLVIPPTGEFSLADLAHFAEEQGTSEMHRAYAIDQRLLPAFANPDQPVPPIIILYGFPEELANCYRVAHEIAMLVFFLQRCIGISHMERLNRDERVQIARVVERLWRCTVRFRPLVVRCQPTLLMVGASRVNSSCAHLLVYMSASHLLQEIVQASEKTGYTTLAQSLGEANEKDALPYDSERLVDKWQDVVLSLRNNSTVFDGFKLLTEAFHDLSSDAVRAMRYEQGLPIIPTWMKVSN